MTTSSDVYKRMQKLMAMIEGGTNENEVKVAQKKLYSLLNKHKDIDMSIKENSMQKYTHRTGKKKTDFNDFNIFDLCCEFCGCYSYYTVGAGKYSTYGLRPNINDSLYLYNSFKMQLEVSILKNRIKGTDRNSYKKGFISRLRVRLSEITKGYVKYNGEKGIVCINDSVSQLARSEALALRDNKLGTRKTKSKCSANAYNMGTDAGDKATLNHRIDTTIKNRQIA